MADQMTDALKSWQDLLDSLSTAGGNIFVLFVCSLLAGIAWAWLVHKNAGPQIERDVFGVFTGFTGALLLALRGNSSRQQMQDRIDTTARSITEPASTTPPRAA